MIVEHDQNSSTVLLQKLAVIYFDLQTVSASCLVNF